MPRTQPTHAVLRAARACTIMLLSIMGPFVFGEGVGAVNSTNAAPNPILAEATRLQDVADSLFRKGNYREALEPAERALAIREKILGPEHPDVATSLNRVGSIIYTQGRFAEAEQFYQRSLKIREKALGPEHLDVAKSLNNLANLYRDQNRYPEAEPLFLRSLRIREKALGPDHPDVAASLNNLAALYQYQGRVSEAEPLLQRALMVREMVLGPDHPEVAKSLNNLASIYASQSRYAEAEPLFQRAVKIWEKALGPDHPDVAAGLTNLAGLYRYQGRYAEAEPLYQRSLKIWEGAFGAEHPGIAASLDNLAVLFDDQGRYAEAEPLFRRALKIREKALGPDHRDVGNTLDNLANLFRNQGRYAEAEPLYRRAVKIWEKALGADHPDLGASLNNLANLYQDQGRYAEAESLFHVSLKIREKAFGPEHRDVAESLNNLANLYQYQGRYAEAVPLYQRALKIRETVLGPDHPGVAQNLADFALCSEATGRSREALAYLTRGMGIEQANMGRLFAVSSEPAMRDYLSTLSSSLDMLLSLARESAVSCPEAADSAFVWTLRRKAMILETLIRFREARQLLSDDPAVARQLGELRGVQERLNRLVVSPNGAGGPAGADSQAVALRQEGNRLEAALNRRVSERLPREMNQSVDLEPVRHSLPAGSALVELVRARLVNFRPTGVGSQWEAPHYLAFVLTPEQTAPPPMVDLGDAEKIDRQVREVRESLQLGNDRRAIGGVASSHEAGRQEPKPYSTPDGGFGSRSRELYRQVFAPLRSLLGAARMVYVAPDGELNRVPFEALLDEKGKYLIESYGFAYLTSGKNLLEPPSRPAQGTVVFAAPDYNLGVRERKTQASTLLASAPSRGQPVAGAFRSAEVRGWRGWAALPGTTKEAAEVRVELDGTAYGPVRVYTGNRALEEAFKALSAPRVMHVATHGYFFAEQKPSSGNPQRLVTREDPFGGDQRLDRIRGTENPLLRSGFVLAGANAAGAQGDSLEVEDGWVTAEEIGMMDLRGTELVVMSACETGLGDVRQGEGVSGLGSAFRYAGARTLVMSLFQVDDAATQDLMGRFYRGLKRGRGKLEALREAQLGVIRERRSRARSAHPFYWASFVLFGDPH